MVKLMLNYLDNGYYDYDEDSVYKILKKDPKINVIYARVSTYKQKVDLHNQINNITIDNVFSDIHSGLDFERPNFNKLINDV